MSQNSCRFNVCHYAVGRFVLNVLGSAFCPLLTLGPSALIVPPVLTGKWCLAVAVIPRKLLGCRSTKEVGLLTPADITSTVLWVFILYTPHARDCIHGYARQVQAALRCISKPLGGLFLFGE